MGDFEHGLDSIFTYSINTSELAASLNEADAIPSSISTGLPCSVITVSDTSRLQLDPSIKSLQVMVPGKTLLLLIYWNPHVTINVSTIKPVKVLCLNALNHCWTYQVSTVFPPPALVPLVLPRFLAVSVTGPFRLLILVASHCMEVPSFSKALNMFADIPHQCPIM